ncbi:hypothetical protein GCM10011348_38280 [Marinobacterium nitratireducens]|uniref:Uncharacterized protein n=1 Tax=Marinobacterium nitratireducens TaxID=518897 RepID=A0A917ZMS9_9GAMM|nr:hypothetical protein [Marinobacterium nitratireducens]GGO86740.1 hypothetical protein GCM10011348_38280 [Marinobacterium nitratireducens]
MIHETPIQVIVHRSARQRALFWALALAFIVGLLSWQLQAAKPGGAISLVSGDASALALGEGAENPLSAFDTDVDDPPLVRLLQPRLCAYFLPVAERRDGGSIRRVNSHPARAPPALSFA